jgi:hypothetical protein
VHYRWHPLFGRELKIDHVRRRPEGQFFVCEIDESGRRLSIPAWMTEACICSEMVQGAPIVTADALAHLHELLIAVSIGSVRAIPERPKPEGGHAADS